MKFKLCLDKQKFSAKPQGSNAAIISSRIGESQVDIDFDEFLKAISSGQTYSPGIYRNSIRKAANWVQQNIFVADIDDGNIQYEEIQSKLESFDLDPAVIHESFSSTPDCRKWRIIFISDIAVVDPADALAILRKIQQHFDSDSCVVDLARMLYSTTSDKVVFSKNIRFSYKNLDLEQWHKQAPSKNSAKSGKLPEKSKHSRKAKYVLDAAVRRVMTCRGPRYQIIWQAARMMAQSQMFSEASIRYEIVGSAKMSRNFDLENWDKNIDDVIDSAIRWGRNHVWEE